MPTATHWVSVENSWMSNEFLSTTVLSMNTIWKGITLYCFSSFIASSSVYGCLWLVRFSWVISFYQETPRPCVMAIISRPKGYIALSGLNRNRWTENIIILRKRLTSLKTVRPKVQHWKKRVLDFMSSRMHIRVHINWLFFCNPCWIKVLLRHGCMWLYPTQSALPGPAQNMCLNTSSRFHTWSGFLDELWFCFYVPNKKKKKKKHSSPFISKAGDCDVWHCTGGRSEDGVVLFLFFGSDDTF